MDFIFADDSEQKNPTRQEMRPLIGLGGVHISAELIGDIEHEINELCSRYGFPDGEEFKWSPSRDSYMHDNIKEERRVVFYNELFEISSNYKATAIVVASDLDCNLADSSAENHNQDVTIMFLERANKFFNSFSRNGAVIIDKPGGGHKEEKEFISNCLETLEKGTDYVKFDKIPLPVMTADSKHIRLLQLADVITSCSIARIAGENRYSPEIFELIKPLFREGYGRMGGIGLKIHPDMRYQNLYHWLLGDDIIKRGDIGIPLPEKGSLYDESPGEPD